MARVLLIPAAVLALLAGAVVWSGGGVERRADFTFINRGDIFTLDLNQMSYMQDFRLTYGIREGLYGPDPQTFRPIPAGAAGHTVSPDARVWEFHLRPGAKWSNGDPVTAHDYAFSWRRMLEDPGQYTFLFYSVRNARQYELSYAEGEPIDWREVGIEAVDDRTFRVTVTDPVPYLLDLLAFPPFYPRHERSMRPFRVFNEGEVFDRLEEYLDAAGKVDAGAAGDDDRAAAGQFMRRVTRGGSSPVDPAAVRRFVTRAGPFRMAEADLPEVLALLDDFAALDPFAAAGDEKAAHDALQQIRSTRLLKYTYRAEYTRPAPEAGAPGVVTNGPFELKRWDFKRRLILEKSPTYWDRDNVRSDRIEMVVNDSPLSQFLLYENGSVDWMAEVNSDIAAELKAKGRADLRSSPAFGTMFLSLLCRPELPPGTGVKGKNPLADVRVRQALAMAIDKRFVTDHLTRMGELPARTYLPPDGTLPDFRWLPGPFDGARTAGRPYDPAEVRALLARPPSGEGPGLPYDPEKARALLADAGYPGGRGFPIIPILHNSENTLRGKIAQTLKDQWKRELNVGVDIHAVEGKIFSDRMNKKDYAISTVAWYGDYPDASTFTDKYLSTSLQNDSDWRNPAFDDLCAAAAKEADPAERGRMHSRAEHMIDTEVPIIPLYHYVNTTLFRDGVHGVEPNPRNMTIFKAVYADR
jgi:oligopeptide transport system substrate-binding protein